MSLTLPVYGEIASLINENPELVKKIATEDLQPILKLKLLSPEAKKNISLPPPPPPPSPFSFEEDAIRRLNANHQLATDMSNEELLKVLKYSDDAYYNHATVPLLRDKIYDYVKRVYGQRTQMTMEKEKTMLSVSSETGVGVKPTKGRDTRLPVPLRSLDNVFKGEGDVDKWKSTHRGPYILSAKMDGTSSLYYQGVLYTRGDATVGRNISHLLSYLKIPTVSYAVRGELVIDKHIFERKYKDKPSKHGTVPRRNNRNSVAGALSSVTNLDEEFLKDLSFVAYEIINMDGGQQMRPSAQFSKLQHDGFVVAHHLLNDNISDTILSEFYHRLIDTYNYEVDGVVIHLDKAYVREADKNPDYAKSYKEALEQDVAITKVIGIEWNVSQYGYLVPTVIYEPVSIGGVTLQRATAHNAREVQNLGLGPGAVIEVVYRAKVNPQVNRVIQAVTPDMPKVSYKWVDSSVNIVYDHQATEGPDLLDSIRIKRIHKFLVEIGAKGIGELTVEKIYQQANYQTVGHFVNIKLEDIDFLGKQLKLNVFHSIHNAMKQVDLPTLMASSKVFGRGLGTKKFVKIFEMYPDFATARHSYEEYQRMFLSVEGFADKTASLAAKGMVDFWEFIDTQLSPEIYRQILANTAQTPVVQSNEPVAGLKLTNKLIYLTGGRSPEVIQLISKQGGTLQSTFSATTNLLVRKNNEYVNKKTEEAETKGILIMSVNEFLSKYR
jgi:NAD-dependent DNA ligase